MNLTSYFKALWVASVTVAAFLPVLSLAFILAVSFISVNCNELASQKKNCSKLKIYPRKKEDNIILTFTKRLVC